MADLSNSHQDPEALREQIRKLQEELIRTQQEQSKPTDGPTTAAVRYSAEPKQRREGPSRAVSLRVAARQATGTAVTSVRVKAHQGATSAVETYRSQRDAAVTAYHNRQRRRAAEKYDRLRLRALDSRNPAPQPTRIPNVRPMLPAGRDLTGHDSSGVTIDGWEPPLAPAGAIFGVEQHSHSIVRIDPWQHYQQGLNSPNIFLVGQQGYGKTMAMLLWIARQVRAGRLAVIIDPKDTGGEGECAKVGRSLGWTVVTFGHGGARINLLDSRISQRSESSDDLTQARLLYAVAETALGRSLQPDEREAIAAALDNVQARHRRRIAGWLQVADDLNADELAMTGCMDAEADAAALDLPPGWAQARPGDPILSDLLEALFRPTPAAADAVNMTYDELVRAGRDVGLMLRDLLRSDLGATIDGPTTLNVDLNAPAIVFDVSQLPKDSITLPIVMTIINTFIHNAWWKPDGRKRILAIDEATALLRHLGTARALEASEKTSRGKGMAHVVAVQQTENVVGGVADAQLGAAIQAVINEAETVIAFRQDPSQATALSNRRALTRKAVKRLSSLPTGHAIIAMSNRPPVEVKTNPTDIDIATMNSNAAMQEEAATEQEEWWADPMTGRTA